MPLSLRFFELGSSIKVIPSWAHKDNNFLEILPDYLADFGLDPELEIVALVELFKEDPGLIFNKLQKAIGKALLPR